MTPEFTTASRSSDTVMTHDELLEEAKKAITAVFGDRSVSPSTTIESLKDMASDIDTMLDAFKSDMQRSES